jgi:endonuclease/exonuclease/phosphatase family metal-dependent hydrolase
MKKLLLSITLLLALITPGGANARTKAKPATLTVVTYNLKYASVEPPNSWLERRPLMTKLIRKLAPDVMGTQEGLYSQLKDMAADLPDYAWIGLGREGGSRGEFMAVFYRKARLEPLAFDHFWLSDTPEVIGSTTWGNTNRRMVTWIKFRDRVTGTEFYHFNTHFDHQVQLAREKSAELLRKRVEALGTKLPVILTGDFNAAAGANKSYDILTAENFLKDAWLAAPERHGEGFATFNSFKAAVPTGERIDWILTRGDVKVDRAETVLYKTTQFPSDHFPVIVKIQLGIADGK